MNETLTLAQLEHARQAIRKHYGLNRHVTDKEVWEEVQSLRRKFDYDDADGRLAAALQCGSCGITLSEG